MKTIPILSLMKFLFIEPLNQKLEGKKEGDQAFNSRSNRKKKINQFNINKNLSLRIHTASYIQS